MIAVEVTRKEGDRWIPFKTAVNHYDLVWSQGIGGQVHSIKFDNGLIWDTVNGWRKNSRVRVKMGRKEI